MLNQETNLFTKAQERAISHFQGPCLVLAGPGSGKTKVITHRVAHLIEIQKIPPEHILTITFTKAAATEMKERFFVLSPNANSLFCTFHSCFYYILKNSHLQYPQNFITKNQKQNILKRIVGKIIGDVDIHDFASIERLLGIYINQMQSKENISDYADIDIDKLEKVFLEYRNTIKRMQLIDFDILQLDAYELLKEHKEIRRRWQNQFRIIQIDECQDMNLVQYKIIKLLAGKNQNVFMVGDDDQSIYRFRGSDISLMKRFIQEFDSVKEILLETNFRSTEMIVDYSQKVIHENNNRFEKEIISCNQEKSGVEIKNFTLRDDMFQFVIEKLKSTSEDDLNDSAIICRTNAELKSWGYVMRQNGISYQSKEEQISIFDQAWFLDIEAYLKIAIGKYEIEEVMRIVNKPNRNLDREGLIGSESLPKVLQKDIKAISNMRPFLAMKYIWNGVGYGKWLKYHLELKKGDFAEVLEQLQMLLEASKKYYSIKEWLEQIETDRVKFREKRKPLASNSGVHLITMHSSKGLEFETVYIPDLNKGKMPRGFLLDQETIEEERRLLYVAMTRAKKHLNLLYIKGTEDHKLQPSVFIEPILGMN